jgi:hypothetical protein
MSYRIAISEMSRCFTGTLQFLSLALCLSAISSSVTADQSRFDLPFDSNTTQRLLLKEMGFIDFNDTSHLTTDFNKVEKLKLAEQRLNYLTKNLFSQMSLPHRNASRSFSPIWFETFDFVQFFFDPS